jgi:hypothetical protein
MANEPNSQLAEQVLPAPLYQALCHVFAQGIADCMLVGGTALAGYYAGHRRSDDLDLFVRDAPALEATILAVESLSALSGRLHARQHTSQFYDVTCELSGRVFTIQVVLDSRVFEVGRATSAADGVTVADLETILKQKAATLVSRCSEKDLYDLAWLFRRFPTLEFDALLDLGAEIDLGITAEAVMLSLTGTSLRESACDFSTSQLASAVYRVVTELKASLAKRFDKLARKQQVGPVGELIKSLKG